MVGWTPSPTFKKVYVEDKTKRTPVRFFAQGYAYKILGLVPANIHLLGVEGARAEQTLFVLGTSLAAVASLRRVARS